MTPKPRSRWPLRLYAGLLFGVFIGTYSTRGAANKVIDKLAYEPEPR